jgi:hypothetical protein
VTRQLFALDHNFPEPVLSAFADVLPMVELVPVRAVDPAWARLDDWELLAALHRHRRPWDGLITNDDHMLALPREMTVLSQTGLTLVVSKGEGHNPIRAVGTLLCHIPFVCHHTRPGHAQIWNLRMSQKNHEEVGDYLEKIAQRTGVTVGELLSAHRLAANALRQEGS